MLLGCLGFMVSWFMVLGFSPVEVDIALAPNYSGVLGCMGFWLLVYAFSSQGLWFSGLGFCVDLARWGVPSLQSGAHPNPLSRG